MQAVTGYLPGSPAQQKKLWVRPEIEVIQLRLAEGAFSGPMCDKYGSLSHGTNCAGTD
jgi:hypothetical protein